MQETLPVKNLVGMQCSFCGRWNSEVRKLILGPRVSVCDQCIELMVEIIREETDPDFVVKKPIPEEHKRVFKEFVKKVTEEQKPCPPEYTQVLIDNFEELLA